MESYTWIVIIFGILLILFLLPLFFINRLLLQANKIEIRFDPIKTYIEEKKELLDNIALFIKNNIKNEEELIKKIEETTNELKNIKDAKDGIPALKKSEELEINLNKLEEINSKLTENKEYQSLKTKLKENQNRINYAKDSYNEEVTNYNNYKKKKILSILNKLFSFQEYTYYKKEL